MMASSAIKNFDSRGVHQELITGSVVIAAIVMFIWTGGSAMMAVVRYLTGVGPNVEQLLLTALLLNIALILFGWRRYRDLEIELRQRRETEERARILAETDSLTGCLNRRSFVEKATEMLAQAEPTHQSVAILLLDLDHFKSVNDVHGHDAGDQVLITAARRIKAVMPVSAMTARLGGDEFACALLFDPRLPDHVDALAGQLVKGMTEPIVENGLHFRVGASIGIARSDSGVDDIGMLLKQADIAMYWAKKRGRNGHAWFDASMEREFRFRHALEAGIRQGIRKGEFLPHYEPQIDLSDGRIVGFDILSYWNHPVEGVIPPALFAPFAEENGLVGELSLTVMQRAFEEARNWDPSLILSAPVSLVQLKDQWLSQKVCKLLVETGFVANRLELRIGERALLEHLDIGQPLLGSLKNQGIRIALDDFGTVYCSPARLKDLPVDRIRISRGYLSSLDQIEENLSIIGAIMRLADHLALPVVVDGIEGLDVGKRVKELGCAHGLGPLFGPIMSIGQVRALLTERNLLLPPQANAPRADSRSAEALPANAGGAPTARLSHSG
ncbi:MAG: EAL domain-containing protein [Sphingomonadales bacterium]|nr:MAG: EAL domain-containing protein [Sphingomonadales bacterium]TNF05775.1 MAG: EAL domain-containing protein [Sphingomonadales bacterium]